MGSSNSKMKDTFDSSKCPPTSQTSQNELSSIDVTSSNGSVHLEKGTRYDLTANDKSFTGTFDYAINDILYFTKVQLKKKRNEAIESTPLSFLLPDNKLLIDKKDIYKYEINIYRQTNTGGKTKKTYKKLHRKSYRKH